MGLSCRAWTSSQISLLFGLEGLVQVCFELFLIGFKGLRLNSRGSQFLPKLPGPSKGWWWVARGYSLTAKPIGLYLYRLL